MGALKRSMWGGRGGGGENRVIEEARVGGKKVGAVKGTV